MAILVKGKTFGSTEQVTSAKLHQLVDSATFDTGAVDDSTIALSGGVLIVKDGGITGAKLSSTVAIPSAATATTQAADTNTTAIATTAFAKKEADDAQAYAIQRSNHTGTQAVNTITGLGALATTGTSAQISKAWVNYNAVTQTINSSFNVSSVTKNATGDYSVNFSSNFSNTGYCVVCSATQNSNSGNGAQVAGVLYAAGAVQKSTSTCRIYSTDNNTDNPSDPIELSVCFFGN